jgi:hypothetical protein
VVDRERPHRQIADERRHREIDGRLAPQKEADGRPGKEIAYDATTTVTISQALGTARCRMRKRLWT